MARKDWSDKPKGSWSKAKQIIRFVKPYRGLYTVSFIFLLLSSATNMAFPLFFGKLFSAETGNGEIDLLAGNNLASIVTLLFLIFGAQSVFSFFRIYTGAIVTENVLYDIRRSVYQRLVSLPMDFYNRNKVGELSSRLSSDIELLQENFNTTFAEFIRQFLVLIFGLSMLAILSWKLSLIMLAIVPVVALIAVVFGRFIRNLSKESRDKVAESNHVVEESLSAIQNVKAFVNEWYEYKRYSNATHASKQIALRAALWRASFVSFIIFGLFGAILVVLWQGVLLTEQGDLEREYLYAFIMYSVFIGASFGSLPELYSSMQKGFGAGERLMELLNEENEKIVNLNEKNNPVLKGKVEFDRVNFTYATREDNIVLNDLSLLVEPGQKIAIVGSSGSGKSTIASLLLQFYKPQSGRILFDDKDANDYSLFTLRSQMAIVPQEVMLFSGTIEENIAYGKPGSSKEELLKAAEQANAMEFINRFSDGMQTVVGDRGIQLSGGQKQRIAIARALLKNPKILILDEATSALDSASESVVQKALEQLMRGRTSFIIAHRLSTIKNADKIIVLEGGKIIESGTHAELMGTASSTYSRLNAIQTQDN